jgi:hypothetical protein
MFENSSVSVIIPALDEEQAIARVLAAIPAWVDDVIVVDNGSTDQTAAIARHHGAHVVRQPLRGYGAACLAGIEAASDANILVFLDGDYSDHPEQMDRLVAPIARGDADLVIGSRVRGGCDRGVLTLQQRCGNALTCLLMRKVWGHRYTDLGPFRAIRRAALSCLRMDDRTYGWTIQMQIRAIRAGLRIREVPVDYRRRIGRSKITRTVRGVIGASTRILSTVVRERWQPPTVGDCRVRAEHLIVFTRFPEPGVTKTRLIPALRGEGAAELQRAMAVQTLEATDRLRSLRDVSVEVRFAGGDASRMAALFGHRYVYLPQRSEELGARMHAAFAEAFAHGAQRVVVVGTDCPELDAETLIDALDTLRTHDCVIGPARDGGYYMIGLRHPCRQIFEGIAWGSAHALEQTQRNAIAAGLTVRRLAMLTDVDEPQDLAVWQQHRHPRISVIVPAINEAQSIAQAMRSACAAPDVEVIVVDGGSHDETPKIARAMGARVVSAPAGRARQMNVGAASARGSVLLFLHADTSLPVGFQAHVYDILAQPSASAGAFHLRIAAPGRSFRWIERFVQFRSTVLQFPYGDQAIFVRAETFRQVGGFPDWPIMEDYELVRRLRRIGRIAIVPMPVTTSARRWLANGVWRTTLANQACIVARYLGVSLERLAGWRGRRGDEAGESACSPDGYGASPAPHPAPFRPVSPAGLPERDVDPGPNTRP